MLVLFFCVLIAAVLFEYINGFHDAANAIATVVSTKVLTPRQAIILAAFFNLVGALTGTAVAKSVGTGFVDPSAVTLTTVFAALLAAVLWNLATWWFGIPSSSSHALIAGLCGAAVASSDKGWAVLEWTTGLWPKLVRPMFLAPLAGFLCGFLLMALLNILLFKARPSFINKFFGRMQIMSAALMGFSHGSNDAQKTMGIIALAMFAGTQGGAFDGGPKWLSFFRLEEFAIPSWVVILCAITMCAGTAAGGWRIIKTMGHKMVKLLPVNGFAAETSAALVIKAASLMGIPLSTTQVISTSIIGVGAVRRFSAVKWGLVQRIVWAWVVTLPVAGFLGYWTLKLLRLFHF